MDNVVIMGGAGFIGSAILREMGSENLTVFDNFSPIVHSRSSISDFMSLGANFIVGDATSRDDIVTLLDSVVPDVLVYLVAETGTGRSLYNIEMNARVNVLGLGMVLDQMSKRNLLPKRVVITSTRAVYGEGAYKDDTTGEVTYPEQRLKGDLDSEMFEYQELTPLNMNALKHLPKPVNIYGSTKLAQENLLMNWARSFDIPCYVFRLQNVYGGGQSLTNPYTGVLVHFLNQVSTGKKIQVFENGGITRDFVHVSDVAKALIKGINGEGAPGIYDVGSGIRSDLYDVASELSSIAGGEKPETCSLYRIGDVRHACADIGRTVETFRWNPEISLSQGLRDVYDFFMSKN